MTSLGTETGWQRVRGGRTGRMVQLLIGLFLYGIAIAMMIRAAVGVSPWDCLAQGLSLKTGLGFGLVTNIVGGVRAAALDPDPPAAGDRHRAQRAADRPERGCRARLHRGALRTVAAHPALRGRAVPARGRDRPLPRRPLRPGAARRADDRHQQQVRLADLGGAHLPRGHRAGDRLAARRQRRLRHARVRAAGRAAGELDHAAVLHPPAAGRGGRPEQWNRRASRGPWPPGCSARPKAASSRHKFLVRRGGFGRGERCGTCRGPGAGYRSAERYRLRSA